MRKWRLTRIVSGTAFAGNDLTNDPLMMAVYSESTSIRDSGSGVDGGRLPLNEAARFGAHAMIQLTPETASTIGG